MQSSKGNILNKIKKALENPTPMPFSEFQNISQEKVFPKHNDDLAVTFARNFSKAQGQFIFCASAAELANQLESLQEEKGWKKLFCRESEIIDLLQKNNFRGLEFSNFPKCEAAITGCEKLIARTGSILMSSAQASGRATSIYTPVHICIAFASQIVYDIEDGLTFIQNSHKELPSLITLATGPSRTADIEKTLVVGVHGPAELYCFVVENA